MTGQDEPCTYPVGTCEFSDLLDSLRKRNAVLEETIAVMDEGLERIKATSGMYGMAYTQACETLARAKAIFGEEQL